MTETSNTHDPKCVHRISTNITDSDLELLDEEFQKTNFTSRSEYIRAIIRGKTPGKKSTIFNVPSINEEALVQLKGACNNLNQYIKHLNFQELKKQSMTSEFRNCLNLACLSCVALVHHLELFSALLDGTPKNKEAVKNMARHKLILDDYLDLLTLHQIDELLQKKVDQEYDELYQ
jgi:hypothetical protein